MSMVFGTRSISRTSTETTQASSPSRSMLDTDSTCLPISAAAWSFAASSSSRTCISEVSPLGAQPYHLVDELGLELHGLLLGDLAGGPCGLQLGERALRRLGLCQLAI